MAHHIGASALRAIKGTAGCLDISIKACGSLMRKLDITTESQTWLKFLLGNASMNPGRLPKDRAAVLREASSCVTTNVSKLPRSFTYLRLSKVAFSPHYI